MGRIVKAREIRTTDSCPEAAAPEIVDGAPPIVSPAVVRAAIAGIAGEMAKQIVGEAVAMAPERLECMYQRAVGRVGVGPEDVLTVHPDDHRRLGEGAIVGICGCRVVTDTAVGQGGYVLKTCWGEIDGAVDTLIGALRDAAGAGR